MLDINLADRGPINRPTRLAQHEPVRGATLVDDLVSGSAERFFRCLTPSVLIDPAGTVSALDHYFVRCLC